MSFAKSIAPCLLFAFAFSTLSGCGGGGGGESAKPAGDAPKVEAKEPGSTNPGGSLSNPYNPPEKSAGKAKKK
ncbi:MAG: hypothetical protein ACKO5E_22495 [bacterium]